MASPGPESAAGADKGWDFPRRFTIFFILALSAAQYFSLLYEHAFAGVDNRWVDQLFRWRGMERADPRVNIIAMDDHSIGCIGQYPWPRGLYASLLDSLYGAGVKQVGFDIMFLEPSRPAEDEALIAATRKAGPRLVHDALIDPSRLDSQEFQYPFPKLRSAVPPRALGIVTQPFIDGDGVVRLTPLLVGKDKGDPDAWAKDAQSLPSFGLAVLSNFEGKDPRSYVERAHTNVLRLNIRGQAERVFGEEMVNGVRQTVTHPVFGINRIPVWKLLKGYLKKARAKPECLDGLSEEEAGALKGSIALVGYTAIGTFDHYPTAFSESAPGVEVHANLIDNLLNDRYLRRLPWWVVVGCMIAMGGASLGLMALAPLQAAAGLVGLLGVWIAATFISFRHLYVLDFTGPAVSLAGTFAVLMVHKTVLEQRGKKEIQQMFGQYVAPEVVDLLVKDRSKLRLGGDKRDMTVFFLDIAHFTTISEKMAPEKLIQFLNHYLTALSDIILKNKGVVDKYIGDCIMAFWNAPIDVPNHRALACLSAVECIEAIKKLNEEYVDPSMPEKPAVRIGLNSGEVVVGNTGSARKLAYTVLGDEVNLASRLEGANKFFGSTVMASENAFKDASDAVEGRVLGMVRVVGKAIPIKVFELLGKKGGLSKEWQEALPLYNKGVEAYLKRDFEAAKAEFEKVLKLIPEDKPTKLYLSVCDDYAVIPPPPEWDGVFNLTAK